MVMGLEGKKYEEQLRFLGLFSPRGSCVTATGPEGTAWSCVGGGAGWGLGKGSSPEIGQEQE